MRIKEATDKARYVEWISPLTFAVWKGEHTVNFYSMDPNTDHVEPTGCINVGSFENDEATLQEVKEGIESYKE